MAAMMLWSYAVCAIVAYLVGFINGAIQARRPGE